MRLKAGGWPYSQPPNVDFELNWKHPILRGLVFALPLFGPRVVGGQRFVDLAQRRILTPFNTPAWTSDNVYGSALLFDDAATEYLNHSTAIIAATPLTMASWFLSNDDTAEQTLLSIHVPSGASGARFTLQAHGEVAGNPIQAETVESFSLAEASTTTGFTANKWHHAAGVFASVTDRRAFIDGGSKGTNNLSRTPANLSQMNIGATFWNTRQDYMSGRIAEALIWNRALSDGEVAYLANPNHRWEIYQPRQRFWAVSGKSPTTAPGGQLIGRRLNPGSWPYKGQPPNVPFEINWESPQSKGLVAWWPTMGSQGGNRIRERVLGNNGTLTNSPTWVYEAETGWGLNYASGSSEYVQTTYMGIGGANPRTIIAWIKTNTSQDGAIFGWGTSVAGQKWVFRIDNANNDVLRTEVDAGYLYASTGVDDGEPHCVASVFAGSNVTDVLHYIDGQADATGGSLSRAVNTNITTNAAQIGASNWDATPKYFDDFIGEVRVYNRALLPSMIADIATNPWKLYKPKIPMMIAATPVPADIENPGGRLIGRRENPYSWPYKNQPPNVQFEINKDSPQVKGLFAWWPTLSSFGESLLRERSRGLFGSFNGTLTWVRDGTIGPMLDGNGISGYVSLPTSIILNSPPCSFSLWFKTTTAGADVAFSFGSSSSNTPFILFQQNGANTIKYGWRDDASNNMEAIATSNITDGKIHHIVGVSYATNDHRVFIDGVQEGTSNTNVGATTLNTATFLALSRLAVGNHWPDQVGDLRIYNRALTNGEVRQLYSKQWGLYKPLTPDLPIFIPTPAPAGRVPRYGFTNFLVPGIV